MSAESAFYTGIWIDPVRKLPFPVDRPCGAFLAAETTTLTFFGVNPITDQSGADSRGTAVLPDMSLIFIPEPGQCRNDRVGGGPPQLA